MQSNDAWLSRAHILRSKRVAVLKVQICGVTLRNAILRHSATNMISCSWVTSPFLAIRKDSLVSVGSLHLNS